MQFLLQATGEIIRVKGLIGCLIFCVECSSARIDGLVKREETPEEMTETFVGRDDFLYYRHVFFGKRVKKFGPQDQNARPIVVCELPHGRLGS